MKCPKDGLSMWFSSASDKWVCPHCLGEFDINIPYHREHIEEYRGKNIGQYWNENGYRVDMGTMKSKEVATIEEARKLIDYVHSPDREY